MLTRNASGANQPLLPNVSNRRSGALRPAVVHARRTASIRRIGPHR